MIMDVPSIRPLGNPSLIKPIMSETIAAASKIQLIGSSEKFSNTSSEIDLILGGGKEFRPKCALLSLSSFGSLPIPVSKLV